MKFSCTQENIHRGLSRVSHIASRNVNLPILHNVLIEAKNDGIELVATNLEIGVRTKVRAKVEQEGTFTVPAQVLANYISLLVGERVDFELQKNELGIITENQKTKIKGESASDFPIVPQVEENIIVRLGAGVLRRALSEVLASVSHDDSRPELTGVLFVLKDKQLVLASTDSYRLTERKISPINNENNAEKRIIVPAAALEEFNRIVLENVEEDEVQLIINENQLLLRTGEVEITSRLIEGVFPDYEQIIPRGERTTAAVERKALVNAIKTAGLFSRSGIHDISITFTSESKEITLSTANAQIGENTNKTKAEITGENNSIVFNYRYLLDGLNNIATERVVIKLVNSASPGVFLPDKNDKNYIEYLYIIMPIKQ